MIDRGLQDEINAITGLRLPISRPPKSLDSRPCGRRAGGRRTGELTFCTGDSFLLWRLTGGAVHCTDATNASRTLLYDLAGGLVADMCALQCADEYAAGGRR